MLHVHGRPTALATALISAAYIISEPLNILLYEYLYGAKPPGCHIG